MTVEANNADEIFGCAVSLDGARLAMAPGENMQEHDMMLPQGKLRVDWELYRPNFGNTITIQTGAWPFLSTHETPLSLTASCACAAPPQ